MIACPDEKEDGDDSSSSGGDGTSSPSAGSAWTLSDIAGSGWIKNKITVGGVNNNSIGSFLDIDGDIDAAGAGGFKLYTVGQVSNSQANKDHIDLIFDGTNIFTPTGCAAACPTTLKNAITGFGANNAGVSFYDLPSTVLLSMTACAIHAAVPGRPTNAVVNNYQVKPKPDGKYYVETSEGSRALVLIGERTTDSVELVIGYLFSPSACN